ncbi:MAG TPA: helix-turn-helix domain-containing protein [Thermoanaerobaculia bacterium]|nr:helix-turn-helix domain-containing protein [Thermoanaerobaculia bacterium]
MLSYREWAPPARLAPFIRCFWSLSGAHDGGAERILPDGSFELIVHRGDPFRQNGASQPRAMLMGEIRRHVIVQPSGAADVIGVRFRAGGASPFFRFPMSEARDQIVSLDIHSIADVIEQPLYLPRHLELARAAVAEIRRTNGTIRVRELALRMGATERTLTRAFLEVVGVGPKQFARLVRFHASLHSDDTLAFYDQSHHIHEFRAIAGVTPTEFRREQHAVNDAFVGNLQS